MPSSRIKIKLKTELNKKQITQQRMKDKLLKKTKLRIEVESTTDLTGKMVKCEAVILGNPEKKPFGKKPKSYGDNRLSCIEIPLQPKNGERWEGECDFVFTCSGKAKLKLSLDGCEQESEMLEIKNEKTRIKDIKNENTSKINIPHFLETTSNFADSTTLTVSDISRYGDSEKKINNQNTTFNIMRYYQQEQSELHPVLPHRLSLKLSGLSPVLSSELHDLSPVLSPISSPLSPLSPIPDLVTSDEKKLFEWLTFCSNSFL